ncbi:YdcF family protein [Corynebacterium suicordis]|uniref:YdcF family protein n=1 Tax=Corynebacterium suicordis DSM 45110 TaxID=1121369 RepID=A0ABR9ZJP4_9CORY|nr:YdcF family protein [Corynebacterium suicordis]MBF4553223.1 YdcF family protein [Corynebacterium suicordis DSM 45110]MDR6277807.1 uncharacterized SAM-binding protein YcdF (DUF218 family) [Corynebacterium suicordis]
MANTVAVIMAAGLAAASSLGISVPAVPYAGVNVSAETSPQAIVAHVEAFTGAPIVILGARLNPDCSTPGVLQQRLDRAAAFSRIHPETPVYVTGGRTQPSCPITEAAAMELGLRARLVPNAIYREDAAGSTVQNAAFVSRMIGDRAVIVTSQDHLPRALRNFQDAGVRRAVGLAA